MKSKFCFDCEEIPEEGLALLAGALEGTAESDLPLLVELLLTDEEEIRRLNREQRGVDKVTDVLSFPSMEGVKGAPIVSDEHGECVESAEDRGEENGGDALYLGSVVICAKRAREQAEEYGHSFERELYYLAVHGVLHCLGYDHETDEERAEMRAEEERILGKMGLRREE